MGKWKEERNIIYCHKRSCIFVYLRCKRPKDTNYFWQEKQFKFAQSVSYLDKKCFLSSFLKIPGAETDFNSKGRLVGWEMVQVQKS